MDEWLTAAADKLAEAAQVSRRELDLDGKIVEALLATAGLAAHESGQRTNAPLLCFLVGLCVGRGAQLDELRRSLA